MSSTVPQAVYEAAKTTQQIEYAQTIHEVPHPDVHRGTTTPSNKMFNVAVLIKHMLFQKLVKSVRMSPQPEAHTTTTTQGAVTEHAAVSRRTPVPESGIATLTHAGSVENIAVS